MDTPNRQQEGNQVTKTQHVRQVPYNLVRSVCVLLVGGCLLWAEEPWREKPYSEWTKQDVQRILRASPWAQFLTTALWSEVDRQDFTAAPVGSNIPTVQSVPVRSGVFGFMVTWSSALTVRQASARRLQLEGKDNREASEILSARPVNYVIRVTVEERPAAHPLGNITAKELLPATYLQLGRSKQKIPPTAVRLEQNGPMLAAMEFDFPRLVNDKPTIGKNEDRVTFHCRLGGTAINAEFNLRKMVRDSVLDL